MNMVRNVSGQPIFLNRKGRGVAQLFPGRAVAVSEEELKSPQLQNLLVAGLIQIQRIEGKPPKGLTKTEKRGEEKKVEIPKSEGKRR